MAATTDLELVPMRIAKVAGFAPPLAGTERHFAVLDEVSGDRQLAVEIGVTEAFSLAARLQGLAFGRPMTYEFTAALVQSLGGQLSKVRIDWLSCPPRLQPGGTRRLRPAAGGRGRGGRAEPAAPGADRPPGEDHESGPVAGDGGASSPAGLSPGVRG